jgi:integrase
MMRRRDLLPELSSDAIFDRLAYLPEDRSLPEFLNIGQIKALLEAADRHDAKLTDGQGHYHYAIAPFIHVVLLTGLRLAEALSLRWRDVDFDEWVIRLPESAGKGGRGRLITLKESPSVHALLSARKAAAAEHDPFVFSRTIIKNNRLRHDALSRETAESCRKRIGTKFKFPFGWHTLRRTCATFLVCAPGIYGAASAFLAARRLGHSVTVSERLYAGQLTNIPPECRTLEQAMQIAAKPKPIDTTTTDIFVND